MASFSAGAEVAAAFFGLGAGVVSGGRESGDFDRERVCITSKHAQKQNKSQSSQKIRQPLATLSRPTSEASR